MKLYIQIVNGVPYEHPILEDNLRQVIENFDPHNLPEGLVPFERVDCPNLAGPYEHNVVSYEFVGAVVKDVWSVAPMTEEERTAKKQFLIDSANSAHQMMLNHVNNMIQKASGDDLSRWQQYKDQLDAWTLVDPTNPNFPFIPMDEVIFTLSNTSPSGSAPDVIG